MNYNTSAAPAEEVADQIKASGGDALVIGADVSKPEGVDKYELAAVVPIRTGTHASCSDCIACHPSICICGNHWRCGQLVHPTIQCS